MFSGGFRYLPPIGRFVFYAPFAAKFSVDGAAEI